MGSSILEIYRKVTFFFSLVFNHVNIGLEFLMHYNRAINSVYSIVNCGSATAAAANISEM